MTQEPIINPYYILDISPMASKPEITQALAKAIKQKRYHVKVLADAQKTLLNPQKRIVADFLLPVLPSPKRFQTTNYDKLDLPEPHLDFLHSFDELNHHLENERNIEALEHLSLSVPSGETTEKTND